MMKCLNLAFTYHQHFAHIKIWEEQSSLFSRMKKLLYIILIVLSTACVNEDIIEIDYKNCDSILNVYAVLSPQSDSTFIFITNTSSLNKIINLKTLQDGVVTISGNKKSCILKRIKDISFAVFAYYILVALWKKLLI